jgi:hypothetical protein
LAGDHVTIRRGELVGASARRNPLTKRQSGKDGQCLLAVVSTRPFAGLPRRSAWAQLSPFALRKILILPSRRQTTRLHEERIFRRAKGDTDPPSRGFLSDKDRNCLVAVVSTYNACRFVGCSK